MTQRIESELLGSNVFVVGDDEVVLIDSGAETQLVKNVVGGRKVLAVLLTHGHYDHCYYANEYAKEFNCKIYASEKIVPYLKNPDYNYSNGHFAVDDFSNFVFVNGDGQIDFGKVKVQYFALGGHSLSDVAYKIGDEIFVGDVLIGRNIGRLDLYGGNKFDMVTSLKTLQKLDFKILHSGHGEDSKKENLIEVFSMWIKYLDR